MSTPDSMNLGLNTSLRSAVRQKFASALRSGDLLFSETQLAIVHTKEGIPFQLRYCPALSKKPKDNDVAVVVVPESGNNERKPKKKPSTKDPFDNPSPELLISETATGSHILLLNKFPVIPNHFILATKANKPQTHLLERDDLADGQLLAFFNSGEHSGASQPHRHIQFLPVADMRISHTKWQHPDTFDWNPLLLSMKSSFHASVTVNYTSNMLLPIRHFAIPLRDETPASLYSKYIVLLKLALVSTGNHQAESFINYDRDAKIDKEGGEVAFSYNLAMMPDVLAICPRRVESASIPGLDSSHSVSVNGTILAGTLMVKEQQEWDALLSKDGALDGILETIGYPVAQDPSGPNSTTRL
ncbi:hypothetical protein DV738_g5109, partial [Chaetothyriales sp. CBS 135597]